MNNQTQQTTDSPEAAAYCPSAELTLLALMIKSPSKILESRGELRPEWFFLHRNIFDFLQAVADVCHQRGVPISLDTAAMLALAESGVLGERGRWFLGEGRSKWATLETIAPYRDMEAWQGTVQVIREAAARVWTHRTATTLANRALTTPASALPGLTGDFAGMFHRIAVGGLGASQLTIGDEANLILERAALAADRPWLNRISNPMFTAWMNAMGGGLARNSLTLLSARSKVGKSALLNQVGVGFAQAGVPVLFLDTEMLQGEQVSRQLALLSGVPDSVIESGRTDEDQRVRVIAAKDQLVQLSPRFEHIQIAGRQVGDIVAEIHAFRRRIGSEVIVVDGKAVELLRPCVVIYDWLQIPSGRFGGGQEWQALGYLAAGLKQCANELQIPIIAACQQSKGAINLTDEEARFGESFIGGSDRLLQYCTSACSLWPVSPAMQAAMEDRFGKSPFTHLLRIDRQRAGQENRTGLPLFYDGACKRWEEITDHDVLDFVRTFKTPTKRAAKPAALPVAVDRLQF